MTSNKVKQLVEDIIISQLPLDQEPLTTYGATYIYNYKSKVSDLPNVCALASKYLNDALKSQGLIKDDNVQYLLHEEYLVGQLNKDDPHILAIIGKRNASNHVTTLNIYQQSIT